MQKVKFFSFSGLTNSDDLGKSFHRYFEVSILDRMSRARYGRCIHIVLYDEGLFKCYYAIIDDWKYINGIPYPVYNIWYTVSEDGINWIRSDESLNFYKSNEGWDPKMACFQ